VTLYRAKDFIDAYRVRAMSPDINDLSGRDGRPDITSHVASRLADELELCQKDVIADIGCGDGALLKVALERGLLPGNLIGVLPTIEEVRRVNLHLLREFPQLREDVVVLGVSDATSIASDSVDKSVCNGVFLLLPDVAAVKASLNEIARITRKGGMVLVGEVPDVAEAEITNPVPGNTAHRSAIGRALQVFSDKGTGEVVRRLKNRLVATIERRVHVLSPPTTYWTSPQDFIEIADSSGLRFLRMYRSPTLTMTAEPAENETRWNYLFLRM